jgi:hypothetical protein
MIPQSLNGVYPDVSCQVSWENGKRVVCRGRRLGRLRSDLHFLGVTRYHMVTGRLPLAAF